MLKVNFSYIKIISQIDSVTVIGQIFSIVVSPVIARIYNPELIGIYADILAMATIIATIMNGKFDLAIIESKDKNTANLLVKLAIAIGLIISSISLVILFMLKIFSFDISISYFFTLFIGLLISQVSVVNHFKNAFKDYKKLSINKLLQSTIGNVLLIIFGIYFNSINSMLIAFIIGLMLIIIYNNEVFNNILNFPLTQVSNIAKKFYRYPKYLIASTFSSELSGNLPIILTTALFNPSLAGFIFMANRLVSIPITFIGNSIGEVYRQQAVEFYSKNGECKKLFLQFLIFLIVSGFFFSILIYFLSEPLVVFFYGEDWQTTGTILKIYTAMMFFQFISTPLSYSIVLQNFQKYDLMLQIIRLLLVSISFIIGYLNNDFYLAIKCYVLGYVIYYLMHTLLQYRSVIGQK